MTVADQHHDSTFHTVVMIFQMSSLIHTMYMPGLKAVMPATRRPPSSCSPANLMTDPLLRGRWPEARPSNSGLLESDRADERLDPIKRLLGGAALPMVAYEYRGFSKDSARGAASGFQGIALLGRLGMELLGPSISQSVRSQLFPLIMSGTWLRCNIMAALG